MKNEFLIIFLVICFFINADNEKLEDWKKEKKIEINGGKKFKEFYLDEEVYKYANNDLSDLRIINKSNDFIPYYIENGYEEKIKKNNKFETRLIKEQVIKSKVLDNSFDYFFEFQILSNNEDLDINKIEISTNQTDYSVQIELYGRNEKDNYELIQNDSIYQFSDLLKNYLELQDVYNKKFYKIIILNNTKKIKIKKMEVFYTTTNRQFYYFKKSKNINFDTKKKDKNSIIILNNQNRLNLLSINLFTEGNYNREYEILKNLENVSFLKSGYIYNFINNEIKIENKKIDFYMNPINNEKIFLKIYNMDNSPIKITRIDIEYKVEKIIFEAKKNDSYRLIFENKDALSPNYDIKSYKEYIKNNDKDISVLSGINDKGKGEEKEKKLFIDYKLFFNIIIFIIAILLILFIFLKLLKTKKS